MANSYSQLSQSVIQQQQWGQLGQLGVGMQQVYRRVFKFFRVNQLVEVEEGAIACVDPLDELRIKVMRWLDGSKVTI